MVNDNKETTYAVRNPIHPKLWNREWLEKQYITKEKSIGRIAKDVGCFWLTVKNALVKQGFEIRRYTMSKEARQVRRRGGKSKKGKI